MESSRAQNVSRTRHVTCQMRNTFSSTIAARHRGWLQPLYPMPQGSRIMRPQALDTQHSSPWDDISSITREICTSSPRENIVVDEFPRMSLPSSS